MIKKNIKDCDMQELLGIIKQYNHLVRNRVVVPQKYHEIVKAVREEIDKRNKEQDNGNKQS